MARTLTSDDDDEYLHSLAVLDAARRAALAALYVDYKTRQGVLNTNHHAKRAALLADYRAKEANRAARQQMIDEDEQASAHLMAGYASSTCGEW